MLHGTNVPGNFRGSKSYRYGNFCSWEQNKERKYRGARSPWTLSDTVGNQLELLNFFKNLFFCRYNQTFQDKRPRVCDLVSKIFLDTYVPKCKELNYDICKSQATKPVKYSGVESLHKLIYYSALYWGMLEYSFPRLFVPWNIRSHDGTFILKTIRSLEHSFPGPFVPWNIRSRDEWTLQTFPS